MKLVSVSRSTLHTEFVYFLDDRIEVGRMNPALFEELRRVAWRDVVGVGAWRETRKSMLIAGSVFAVLALIVYFTLAQQGVAGGGAVIGGILMLLGLAGIWQGRPGAVLRFRVEARHGTLEGALSGFRPKQERHLAELLARVRSAQAAARPAQ